MIPKPKAFTLIELLIVVAIIAILAAIAVPNFLEAQTRAKISRVKADQRSIATGVEAYQVDHNVPPAATQFQGNALRVLWGGVPAGSITTPIAYLTSLPGDPFSTFIATGAASSNPGTPPFGFDKAGFGFTAGQFPNGPFNNFTTSDATGTGFVVQLPADFAEGFSANGPVNVQTRNPNQSPLGWAIWSVGPTDGLPPVRPGDGARSRFVVDGRYDPTNGTISPGYVIRYRAGIPE